MEAPAENGPPEVHEYNTSLEPAGSANPQDDESSVAEASEISSSHDISEEHAPLEDRASGDPTTTPATATATATTIAAAAAASSPPPPPPPPQPAATTTTTTTTSSTPTAAVHEDSVPSSANDISDERRRLTEDEKKQNHVASENKRREAIREGFDRLAEIVPGLQGRGRSEALVLERTLDFLREQIQRRKSLIERIEERGGVVDPKYRVPDLPPDFFAERDADIGDLEDD